MSSHVDAANGSGTDKSQQEVAGPSYARAVRSKLDGKQNLNGEEILQDLHSLNQPEQMEVTEQPTIEENDDTFTPVLSHSRRDRKNDRSKREKVREVKVAVNGQVKEDNKEKASTKMNVEKNDVAVVEKTECAMEKRVFVEAPIPKVNPWQVNKAAGQAGGKRAQSARQEAVVNGQASPVPARERRRCHHKVWRLKALSILLYLCRIS